MQLFTRRQNPPRSTRRINTLTGDRFSSVPGDRISCHLNMFTVRERPGRGAALQDGAKPETPAGCCCGRLFVSGCGFELRNVRHQEQQQPDGELGHTWAGRSAVCDSLWNPNNRQTSGRRPRSSEKVRLCSGAPGWEFELQNGFSGSELTWIPPWTAMTELRFTSSFWNKKTKNKWEGRSRELQTTASRFLKPQRATPDQKPLRAFLEQTLLHLF